MSPVSTKASLDDILSDALDKAWCWVQHQAVLDFPDTTHTLRFPRSYGFRIKQESQSSDLFARATLAHIFLDCLRFSSDQSFGKALSLLVDTTTQYLACAKLSKRAGGWSYFPGLPELPPDSDSLSTIASLFVRAAPEHLTLCQRPLELLVERQATNGAFNTWLIAPEDSLTTRVRMRIGVVKHWRREFDVDVTANAIHALNSIDGDQYASTIKRARSWLISKQHDDGSWPATWYWHFAWPAWLCLRALPGECGDNVRTRTYQHLSATQNPDGGWGPWQTVPLETALTISLLLEQQDRYEAQVLLALQRLIAMQEEDGRWEGTSWIRMPVSNNKSLSWSSDTITTAVAMRALLCAQRFFVYHNIQISDGVEVLSSQSINP